MSKKTLFVLLLLPVFALMARVGGPDSLGHYFMDDESGVVFDWIDTVDGTNADPSLDYSDDGYFEISIPFTVTFYGETYTTAYASSNGVLGFEMMGVSAFSNSEIPSSSDPNNFIAVYWDDQVYIPVDGESRIYTKTIGEEPNRKFVVTWRNFYNFSGDREDGISYQAILYEGAGETKIKLQYLDLDGGEPSQLNGASATVGIEKDGEVGNGLEYSYNTEDAVFAERAIEFTYGLHDYDVGVSDLMIPDTVWAGGEIEPVMHLENHGDSAVSGVEANLTIWDSEDTEIYNESISIGTMEGDIIDTLTFPSLSLDIDDALGEYTYTASVISDYDENPGNDTLPSSFYLMAYDIMIVSADIPEETGLGIERVFSGSYINRSLTEVEAHLSLIIEDSLGSVVHDETIDETAAVSDDEVDFEFAAWTPDEGGDFIVNISASAEGDQIPANDTISETTMVLEHDVEVESMDAPTMAEAGTEIDFSAIVANNGGSTEEFPFILSVEDDYSTIYADTVNMTMEPGDIDTVEFASWTVTGDGDYTIAVNAALGVDQIPENNVMEQMINVLGAHVSSGGPDSMGYSWYDSYAGSGLSYTPIDIEGAEMFDGATSDDSGDKYVLPFSFPFYEETFDSIGISSNGWISLTNYRPSSLSNLELPNDDRENGVIAPLWDDLHPRDGAIYIKESESEVHIIWWNFGYYRDRESEITFEVILNSGGGITFNYETTRADEEDVDMGAGATIGIEDTSGRYGLMYAYNGEPSGNPVFDEFAIRFGSVDSAGPAITVDQPDTLWLIPGSGGATIIKADIVDFSEVVEAALHVDIDGSWEEFPIDSSHMTTYAFSPTGLMSGETYDFYITAEDSLGNETGMPDDFQNFTAYENHFDEGNEDFTWNYKFADNYYTDTAIVEYEWVEIDPEEDGEGIVITGITDDWISMPRMIEGEVDFPFYGNFGSFFRIVSNGYITFDPLHSTPAVYPPEGGIPALDAPKYLIAPFWTDLFMGSTGKIIYLIDSDNDRIIVEWKDFQLSDGATPGELNTFQVILDFSMGFSRIIMNYQEIDPAFSDVAIGIQDGDGLEGIELFTGQYPAAARLPQDGYSVMFYNRDETPVEEMPKTGIPESFEIVSAYPNPFNSQCLIDFTLPEDGNVIFEAYDVMGNRIESRSEYMEAGKNNFRLDASDISTGVYNIAIKYGNDIQTTRVLFVK
ncbi:MAG: T9SS type A sorting domain-containing protein [Candidatus Zixiibacteriota bacterium]